MKKNDRQSQSKVSSSTETNQPAIASSNMMKDNNGDDETDSIPYSENCNINRINFPKDFVFGTGTSAYQHEGGAAKGGRGLSVWDVFTLKTPRTYYQNIWANGEHYADRTWVFGGRIADGSNGNVAVDMYTKYKEDFKMMKNMGFDAFRFSISWPRILPGGRRCLGVNKEGIDFYNDIINNLKANEIEPYVTLFHWDLPHSLEQEYGGFLSEKITDDFREFAELCFWEFGDRVKYWITLNEPWTYSVHGYVNRIFPPGTRHPPDIFTAEVPENTTNTISDTKNYTSKKRNNAIGFRTIEDPTQIAPVFSSQTISESKSKPNPTKDAYTVARNLLLAHAQASKSYRENFQGYQNGKIGITLVSHWFEPLNDKDDGDKKAAKRAVDFMLGWFLEPVLNGQYPKNMRDYVPPANLQPFSEEESVLLKGSIDFLGLNYYTTNYAANCPKPKCEEGYYKDQQVAFSTERDGIPIGPVAGSSWLYIVPWGIYNLLKYINSTYKKSIPPIYITENGVDEKNDHKLTAYEACADPVRTAYHQDHLANIQKAMTDNNNGGKVNVKGYFVWSWCDNFEWVEGYSVRFGIIYIDYMNYLTRYPKHSATWFTKFLRKQLLRNE